MVSHQKQCVPISTSNTTNHFIIDASYMEWCISLFKLIVYLKKCLYIIYLTEPNDAMCTLHNII